MAITATDIQEQSFSIDRKGYDVEEVDDFLERVADEIDNLNAQIADLEAQLDAALAEAPEDDMAGFDKPAAPVAEEPKVEADSKALVEKDAEIEALRKQLSEAQADGAAISQALIVAQRSADETIANANAEAKRIVKAAEVEADRIVGEAEEDRQAVLDEIKQLEDDCDATRAEYQGILKDFITDATGKLHALGESAFSGVHAPGYDPEEYLAPSEVKKAAAPAAAATATATAAAPVANAANYVVPTAVATTAAAKPSAVEKDFSGFGDADDSFSFDDLD